MITKNAVSATAVAVCLPCVFQHCRAEGLKYKYSYTLILLYSYTFAYRRLRYRY